MKRILILVAIVACSIFTANSQTPPQNGNGDDGLLNAEELKRKKWYYSLDDALANPDDVYKLSLMDSKIEVLPGEISMLKNLQILNLNNCKLKELPPEISELKNLQMLSLYKNKLKTLPFEIKELHNLETLYIGGNKIVEVPIWIGGLGKLKRLDISQTRITPKELHYIRRMMPRVEVTY